MFNLAVLISGGGTNLQAIIDAAESGEIPNARVALVVSHRKEAYGLQRAEKRGIPNIVLPKGNPTLLLQTLQEYGADGVVLAGYLSIVPPEVIEAYPDKIINIHPALLPKFGGMGYYGIKVHEAVLASGETMTGATAHLVDNGVDTGAILAQDEVPVLPGDTADKLQKRVLKTEHTVLIAAVKMLAGKHMGVGADMDADLDYFKENPLMLSPKRILVIGSGGREHAIGWKLKQSPNTQLYFAPGNGGTSQIGENVNIAVDALDALAGFAETRKMSLTVVGPELPLTLGIADVFRERGLRIFAPDKAGAELEGSKAFAKRFMDKYGIPTARYDEVSTLAEGLDVLDRSGYPIVVKADGLAAGKGVVICKDKGEAQQALKDMMIDGAFGEAGKRVVIEQFLTGKEVSLLCFTDSETLIPMETASDYKRALDGDGGLNTGGMGCISPSAYYVGDCANEIAVKTLEGICCEGFDYRGVIYIGLIMTNDGPKVLEYNARFGDPETEALLPRLESDLLEIMEATVDKRLATVTPQWSEKPAVCVVLTSKGYPGNFEKGFEITMKDGIKSTVFHAGTRDKDGMPVTDGGRVLTVTALGDDVDAARAAVYEDIEKIEFEGKTYRTDIGK